MGTLKASKTRIPPEAFNRVVYKGERIRVERRGGDVVFIVSAEDLALLEAAEDRLDVAAAREAIEDMEMKGQKPIPLDEVKLKLGR